MLAAGGLVVAWNVPNYMLTSYMPTYLEENVTGRSAASLSTARTSQVLQIAVLWVACSSSRCSGRLSDRDRAQADRCSPGRSARWCSPSR